MTEELFSSKDHSSAPSLFIGCAGWSIASIWNAYFPDKGTHLERYATTLPAVEINTAFYRPHRAETYARWRDSVPSDFSFSVKVPRLITHEKRLVDCASEIEEFIRAVKNLGDKLGCLLVQLPPSLGFHIRTAEEFFLKLREATSIPVACEPRHRSWFGTEAASVLRNFNIAYVQADPVVVAVFLPPADDKLVYIRLHGSPVMYHSSYDEQFLQELAEQLVQHVRAGKDTWCVFDNTASGAAMQNILSLAQMEPIRHLITR